MPQTRGEHQRGESPRIVVAENRPPIVGERRKCARATRDVKLKNFDEPAFSESRLAEFRFEIGRSQRSSDHVASQLPSPCQPPCVSLRGRAR